MSEQKKDPIEEGADLSTQLVESKNKLVTGVSDQQLQELKLYVEGMSRKMDLALQNLTTPSGSNSNNHFFNTPQSAATLQPVNTPASNTQQKSLDNLMDHLCNVVLKIPSSSVIYDQEEVMTLIELVTLSKEDIFGIVDRSGVMIKRLMLENYSI